MDVCLTGEHDLTDVLAEILPTLDYHGSTSRVIDRTGGIDAVKWYNMARILPKCASDVFKVK